MSEIVLQVALPASELDWRAAALCAQVGGDAWYPEMGEVPVRAKAICRACPSRMPCLRYALSNHEEHGLWGGLSREERKEAARARKRGMSLEQVVAGSDAAWDGMLAAAGRRLRDQGRASSNFARYAEAASAARAERRAALGLPVSPAPQSREAVAA